VYPCSVEISGGIFIDRYVHVSLGILPVCHTDLHWSYYRSVKSTLGGSSWSNDSKASKLCVNEDSFTIRMTADLYILAFIPRTGSYLIVSLIQSYLPEQYSQRAHVYADGPATATSAGSGVNIESINKRYAITHTRTTSSFISELYAIIHALYGLFTCKFMKALILADSLSALRAIGAGNWTKHSFTNKIHF